MSSSHFANAGLLVNFFLPPLIWQGTVASSAFKLYESHHRVLLLAVNLASYVVPNNKTVSWQSTVLIYGMISLNISTLSYQEVLP